MYIYTYIYILYKTRNRVPIIPFNSIPIVKEKEKNGILFAPTDGIIHPDISRRAAS